MASVARPSRLPANAKHGKARDNSVPEPILQLKEKLTRHPRATERKFVLNSMKECTILRCIPMQPSAPPPMDEAYWKKLEDETCVSPINVNGVTIGPGSPASSRIEVHRILFGLCQKLNDNTKMSAEALYRELVLHLTASISITEAQDTLNEILASPKVVLQPPHVLDDLPMVQVTIYESDGEVHATFDHHHQYGMYRKLNDSMGGRPWIKLSTVVHERCNLSTGSSVRAMEVRLPRK